MNNFTLPEYTINLALPDYAAIIIAITTVIYTIGTLLLWNTTRKTLVLNSDEIKKNNIILKANIMANQIEMHRNLYTYILSDNDYIKLLSDSNNIDVGTFKANFLATLLINSIKPIYYYANLDFVDKNEWSVMLEDIRDLFKWPIVYESWDEIKKYHSTNFQNFIDSEILNTPDLNETNK